jgi:hypothetical protein
VETGKILHVLSEHGGFVLSVAWSPDGELVATSAVDSVVRIWDAATGAKLQTLGPVYAGDNRIGFGNGHRWVYTMAPGDPPPDGQVHVFDTATGERVTSLREPSSDGIIRTAWFLPGSNGIATCTGDGGLLRRWPADPLPVARERIPMEIEPEVVRKYEMLPEAEIEAYRDAWARRHPRVRTLVERALAVVAAGKADTALEWIAEARALDPRNPATDWGEARVRARRSELFGDPAAKDAERGLAVEAAARAIAGDIVSAERVRNDEWMAPLRGDPRFRAAVGE